MFLVMIDDPEIKALNDCYAALKGIEPDAIERTLVWLTKKFAIKPTSSVVAAPHKPEAHAENTVAAGDSGSVGNGSDILTFPTPGEFLAGLNLTNDNERALAVAAYLQKKEPDCELSGFVVNKELRHAGHGLENITRAIQVWVDSRPQLMIQLRKSGTTRQAKKNYKVTGEGFKWVAAKLANKP